MARLRSWGHNQDKNELSHVHVRAHNKIYLHLASQERPTVATPGYNPLTCLSRRRTPKTSTHTETATW